MHKLLAFTLVVPCFCQAQSFLAFDRSQQDMPAQGGVITVGVVVPAGVPWSISLLGTFVSLASGGAGTGNGTVTLSIPPNPAATARVGSVAVTPEGSNSGYLPGFLSVHQAGSNAPVTLSPLSYDAAPEGVTASVAITTSGAWVAGVVASDWVSLAGPAFGTGNGSVAFTALPNGTSARREAVIIINGQSFAVRQDVVTVPITLSPTTIDISGAGGPGALNVVTRTPGLSWLTYASVPWIFFSLTGAGDGPAHYYIDPNPTPFPRTGTMAVGHNVGLVARVTVRQGGGAPKGLQFVPVAPCRLWDTRLIRDQFDNPHFPLEQNYYVVDGPCGIPAEAQAYSINATVVPRGTGLGYLAIWPNGVDRPLVSTLNSIDGRIKANAAIVPAGLNGSLRIFATNETDLVLDINGYFVDPAAQPQSLAFYPLPPCRVLDTRLSGAPLGGPIIRGGAVRDIPVLASNCGVPATAQAYSLNATVVPAGPLGYLTLWGSGKPQPYVSTLNAHSGSVVANAAIVPAGASGSISAFVTGDTHLVLDVNGYFAPPGAGNAQRFFPVLPCRLLDTRNAAGEFGGPALAAGESRSYRLPLAATCGLPTTASAYALNATVVPDATLGYLTLWPSGAAQPYVSTLNAFDDPIVANAAIVPAGTGGAVSSFVTDRTQLILDVNGYFAP